MAIKITDFKPMQLEILRLRKENSLLIEALQPLANLAQAVFEDTKKEKEGVLYAFNKAEIKYSDLRKATELLSSIK